jgi:sulfur transfer protein SufE
MKMTQQEQAQELVDAFEMFDDWEGRYAFLIDLGRNLPPMDESDKTEESRVHGCQSTVHLVAHARPEPDGRDVIDFVADSNSSLVKGLIAILRQIYSGRSASEILSFDIEGLLARLGLDQHITPGRRNGLEAMIGRIKALASTL